MVERLIIDEVPCPSCVAVSVRQTVLRAWHMYHDLVTSAVQLKNSTKRPQEYLKEMAPMPNFRLEVCCQLLVMRSEQCYCVHYRESNYASVHELSHMQQGFEGRLLAATQVLYVDTTRNALQGHPVLKAELERVRSGLPMAGLDIARYRLDEPSLNRRNDIAAWRSALDNAHSQLEHQYNRFSPTCHGTPPTAAAGCRGADRDWQIVLHFRRALSCICQEESCAIGLRCAAGCSTWSCSCNLGLGRGRLTSGTLRWRTRGMRRSCWLRP